MKKYYLYKVVRPILYFWMKVRYNPIVIGNENIPKDGGVILAGNHTNNNDPLLLGMCTRRAINFAAKIELFKGLGGPFFKGIGLIPVNRKIKDKSVIPACVSRLEEGNVVGIFPEGTINRTKDAIMPFKPGAVVMAIRSNSNIIPFAINGNYKRGKAKILVGKPYKPESSDVEKEIKILENKVIDLLNSIGE